jgi:hypothetical protein
VPGGFPGDSLLLRLPFNLILSAPLFLTFSSDLPHIFQTLGGSIMKLKFNLIIFFFSLLFLFPSLAAAKLLAVDGQGRVWKIDQNTGAGRLVNSSSSGMRDLARDGAGNIYSVPGYYSNLVKINPLTGVTTPVVFIWAGGFVLDAPPLAFSPEDVLYALLTVEIPGTVEVPGGIDWKFCTINLDTGYATSLGRIPPDLTSLTFDSKGTLYGWVPWSGLVTISTSGTPTITDVNPAVGNPHNIGAIVFAPDGTLYGAGNALYKINKTTGVATLVGAGNYSGVKGLEYTSAMDKAAISPFILLLGD